jgi:hypothetical protein
MFPMTVTISNPSQLNAVMMALNVGGIESPKTSPCAGHAVETAKQETKAKVEKPAATEAEQKPEALVQMTGSEAAQALHGHANRPADAPTYQDAAAAITKLSKTKGRDAAVAVLTAFGAAKLPDVKPEQFADIIAAAEKA